MRRRKKCIRLMNTLSDSQPTTDNAVVKQYYNFHFILFTFLIVHLVIYLYLLKSSDQFLLIYFFTPHHEMGKRKHVRTIFQCSHYIWKILNFVLYSSRFGKGLEFVQNH